MQIHDISFFMGLPVIMIWLPILIGVIVGWMIPLQPIIRNKLHYSDLIDDGLISERDIDAIKEYLPQQTKDNIKVFSGLLRKLGLTLYIDK